MERDNANKFSKTTLVLHWLVAISIISLLASGIYMTENKAFGVYYWHKSFGVIILFVALFRLVWRLKNGWPTPVSVYSSIEQILAKVSHHVLIIGSVLMPLSGALMSVLGGKGLSLFSLELIARNLDPENVRKTIAHNQELAAFFNGMHHVVADVMVIVVLLHIAGALKHHIIDKDGTLKRMLGKRI